MMLDYFAGLLQEVRFCRACEACLPLGPKPVIQIHPAAKLLIIGQAPGLKAHQTGIPWNDASGERLREWLGLSREEFYNEKKVAILPMGFCYPGTGKAGDLPPRKECFDLWHEKLLSSLSQVKLTLLIGDYAQKAYLKRERKPSLTETVCNWKEYLPKYIPLPHPSPRNNIWLDKNPWLNQEVIPFLQKIIKDTIDGAN